AVIENLGLRHRQDAWAHARRDARIRCGVDALSDHAPGGANDVRLLVVHRNDEVEAVCRERAQDQVEIAERIRSGNAKSRPGSSRWIVADSPYDPGAIGVGRTDCRRDGRKTFAELRKQLTADLLESLVVDDATLGQNPGTAAIDGHADLNSDVGRRRW